jgi:hypothetical protein
LKHENDQLSGFSDRDPESIRGWRRNIFSGHKRTLARTKARFSGLG